MTAGSAGGAFAPYERFAAGENLGAGAALPPRAFQSPKGEAALWAAQPKKKGTTFVVPFCLQEAVKIDIPDLQRRFKRITHTGLLAGGAFAPCKRFRRRRKPWRRGGFAAPSISITEGWRRPKAAGTQKGRHDFRRAFLFGGPDRIRTDDPYNAKSHLNIFCIISNYL